MATNYANGGISNGVLGFLGVKPEQYAQAQALYSANVPSFSNADRLSGIDSTTAARRNALSAAGGTYLNGDALMPGGAGAQNPNTPTFSAGGMGGIQSDPRNELLWAQSSAQRNGSTFGGISGSLPPGMAGTTGGPSSIGRPGGPAVGSAQGAPSLTAYQQNPYLSQMADVMRGQMTQNLERNVLPGIRSNAIAAGGFGGSRQGVVEANALNDANRTLNDSITGMNFQDFTNQMNRNLQRYGMDQNYTLGQGQLALGNQNSMQNFYNANRGMDLQQAQLGANLFNMGNQGWLSQGQGLYGLGGQQQQAPWNVINSANAGLGQWSGYGTTTSANQGGGAQGFLGGALAGGQLGSLWGGTGSSSVSTPQPLNANYNFAPQGGLGLKWP